MLLWTTNLIYEFICHDSWCISKPKHLVHILSSSILTLRGKCTYSEFFWSTFSRIRTEYGPEKLPIWRLFTRCYAKDNYGSRLWKTEEMTCWSCYFVCSKFQIDKLFSILNRILKIHLSPQSAIRNEVEKVLFYAIYKLNVQHYQFQPSRHLPAQS